MIKRAFDLVASTVGLVLLAPVMAVIGIVVRRASEGSAIFTQERVGRGGRPFPMLKFRSMAADPDPQGLRPLITAKGDTRITRVGATLRATKLDELPQLVNVVRGDMSIVGPRPEVAQYVAMWSEDDRQVILSVRPGITDPATLELRREEELLAGQDDPEAFYRTVLLPMKTRLYRDYVESQTFIGDLVVILRTLGSVVRR